MVLAIAATLYLTFCAFLILPHLGAPAIFSRMAIGLCASEFVASVGWGFTHQTCDHDMQECPGLSGTFESAAALQIPVLSALMFAVAGAYAVFVARRW
jgi:hypothetical protein